MSLLRSSRVALQRAPQGARLFSASVVPSAKNPMREASDAAAKSAEGPQLSEEDLLVYAEPVKIPSTHNIKVAQIQFRSYLPNQLDFFTDFARRAAAALNIPCSGPIPLPVQTSRWTVNKSPFIHKKAQENFERKTHKRLLHVTDTHPDVVRRWVQFLNQHSLSGVGIKASIWEHEDLGVGQRRYSKVQQGEARNTRSQASSTIITEEAFGTVHLENMAPSDEVKAVADQLLADMLKDDVVQEDGQKLNKKEQKEASPSSTNNNTNNTTADKKPANKEVNPDSSTPTTTETTKEDPEQPTESTLTDCVEPLTSGSATLDPELSEVVEKAIAESATKKD
ncbi:mitochondrial 37S ribosomal protein rsm10 [Actinomortierella ambigua]|nr:mitochondrial 37S ribosomal protein rsm10 [Actinomortierella ambigua]